ncbi:hypothetical protein CVIRNUC_007015 [Coccomyxa viridis]|uniref:Secretory carrier-associated membrane protein n=1 Tax=Coccomyxa viridis TaxID=1274662 RepID=A0AAV1ICS3_9CHLO|nr:hypothetical protein CVIRNUC_007015 [Coccomyxa viridis]
MAKDNPFSDNPFSKPEADKVPSAGAYDTGYGGTYDPSAWGQNGHAQSASTSSAWDGGAKTSQTAPPVVKAVGADEDYGRRADQLNLKEKELRSKEAELRKLEQDLRSSGGLKPEKNWPPCCAFTHHDIAGEIPAGEQRTVRFCYWAFLGFNIAVLFNVFGSLVALCALGPGAGRLPAFFLSACYACAGIPGAWILWYMRVYNAAIKDRAFTYAIFFMFFFIHIIFCVWSAISPPLPFSNDWSHTGFMSAIKAIGSNTFTGVIFIIGACFWTLETLWSLWCLKMVYSAFRGNGGERRLKQEVAGAMASHAATHASSRV